MHPDSTGGTCRHCGAPTTEDQDPRYSLTATGLAIVQARPVA